MARKDEYTAEQVIDAIERAGGLQTQAAHILGCHRKTIARYIDKYVTVKEAYEAANETQLDMAEQSLFDQIANGNITAIIFYLKTKGKHRGYVERQEHTGADGGNLKIELVYPGDGD